MTLFKDISSISCGLYFDDVFTHAFLVQWMTPTMKFQRLVPNNSTVPRAIGLLTIKTCSTETAMNF
jgi:hypothetical protein